MKMILDILMQTPRWVSLLLIHLIRIGTIALETRTIAPINLILLNN